VGGRVSADGPPDPATGLRAPTVDERDLLAFVAAGATDDVIARQLGISPRTLRRRLHDLFDELGASNRFHAGVEAARRGWV
jgi:DNA-binding NarL/FixJ family response regulator